MDAQTGVAAVTEDRSDDNVHPIRSEVWERRQSQRRRRRHLHQQHHRRPVRQRDDKDFKQSQAIRGNDKYTRLDASRCNTVSLAA